jgi:hypothetical protein
LAELLVVTSILALLLTSLCGIYLSMVFQWQRQQGQGDALVATSRTFAAVSAELSQAITADPVDHAGNHRAIIYTLPLDKDTTDQYYVPKWVGNALQYRPGTQKAFYLSDSTGQFARTGKILWRGVISGSYPFSYTITPDPSWDADAQRGRISPLDSLHFDTDNWGHPLRVTVTTTTSYLVDNSNTQMTRNLSVFLRNAN